MGGARSSSTSSGEDDGDDDWKAAIYSVASTTTFNGSTPNGVVSTSNGSLKSSKSNNEPQKLKHYQIKVLYMSLLQLIAMGWAYLLNFIDN